MRDLQSPTAELSPQQKRKLLADLLLEKSARPRTFPLSMMQEPLWLLDQLEPGSPFYNIPAAVRLSGPLDVEVLRRSLDCLVRRHGTLRTTFVGAEGHPVQRVAQRLQLDLPLDDLSELDPRQQGSEMERRAVEEAQRPFDLVHGPLLRVRLLRMAETDHLFLLTMLGLVLKYLVRTLAHLLKT